MIQKAKSMNYVYAGAMTDMNKSTWPMDAKLDRYAEIPVEMLTYLCTAPKFQKMHAYEENYDF